MKRIISILLVLIMLLCMLVSCKDDGVPDGMKSATLEGEPFVLYVPEGFSLNTASGISSAYYSQIDSSLTVSARYYTPADAEMTLDGYMTFCADAYAKSVSGFEKTEEIAGETLSGKDARRLSYKMTSKDVQYDVWQISAEHEGDFVSLNIYATGKGMSVYEDFINEIIKNFTLVSKSEPKQNDVVDAKTPDGMKIASSDALEYRLYVPKSWICTPNDGMSDAYYPESERTNVTLTSYLPEPNDLSIEDYAKKCIEEYKTSIKDFSETVAVTNYDIKAGGFDALCIEFGAEYDTVSYKICQVFFRPSHNDIIYSLTYTATENNYELHMNDFRAMVESFSFR